LRHRTFLCIDQQQNAVDHRQHALDLAAEIGMARGIDDIDMRAFIFDRAVLRQNRNATFFFKIVGIHHPVVDLLVVAEGTRLTQKLVDECGFAVIDVGDDGDVTNCAFGLGHEVYIVYR